MFLKSVSQSNITAGDRPQDQRMCNRRLYNVRSYIKGSFSSKVFLNADSVQCNQFQQPPTIFLLMRLVVMLMMMQWSSNCVQEARAYLWGMFYWGHYIDQELPNTFKYIGVLLSTRVGVGMFELICKGQLRLSSKFFHVHPSSFRCSRAKMGGLFGRGHFIFKVLPSTFKYF